MPFALVVIGLLLIVTGTKDTYQQFGALLVKDFTGPGNFTYWLVSIGTVGALGYNEKLRPFSRAFLFLILVGMIIRNGGFFDKFNAAIKSGPAPTPATATASGTPAIGTGTASGIGSDLGALASSIGLPALPTLPSLPTGPGGASLSSVVSSISNLASKIG